MLFLVLTRLYLCFHPEDSEAEPKVTNARICVAMMSFAPAVFAALVAKVKLKLDLFVQ